MLCSLKFFLFCLFTYLTIPSSLFTIRWQLSCIWFTTLLSARAFNVTVCDCGSAESKGFLKFSNDDCESPIDTPQPEKIRYEAYTTIPTLKRFTGHTCSTWDITITIYRDFLLWDKVTRTRTPRITSEYECRKMRDLRTCGGKSMDVLGMNKWSLEGPPAVQGSWLQTTTSTLKNCYLEEVTLESECSNCTIFSPLGDIPGTANGSYSHNLVTIVWDNNEKPDSRCIMEELSDGDGLLFNTTDPQVRRIRDPTKQVDFLFNMSSITVCKSKLRLQPVIGMEGVIIRFFNTTSVDTNQTSLPITNGSDILWAEIEAAGHVQFIRDKAVEMSNILARELRDIQCNVRKLAHQNAISTAQYNGWLAAGYLDLPVCAKLTTSGEDVAIIQCQPRNVSFSTEITVCGPQPRHGNYTINVEGWELTRYSECYWYANIVNFNGRAHTFRNGTWSPVLPSVVIQGRTLINTLPMEADNTLDTVMRLHPAIQSHPMSPAAAIADILAAVQGQNTIDFNSDLHMSGVLVDFRDAPHISFMARVGNWLRNFGILSGTAMTIAIAFRFCGLGTLMARFIPCCAWLEFVNPFSWLANNPRPSSTRGNQDIEAGHPLASHSQPLAPSNITLNLSTTERQTPTVANTDFQKNLLTAESIRAHREAATHLQ